MRKYFWVHSFDKAILNSGVFMHTFYNYLKIEKDLELELFSVGKKNFVFSFFIGYFKLLFLSNKSDVIHVQYGSFSGLICGFLPRKKLLTLRGSDIIPISSGSFMSKIHSLIGVMLTKISLARYDRVIIMSNQMKQYIPIKFHYKVSIIPDPIDLNKFVIKNKLECRKRVFPNIDFSKILVLFTSIDLANPIKRYPLAIESIELLNKVSDNRYQLVTATSIDNVNMVDVYNAVDICLLTSSHEGWPNCIKEALACNIPFVSTDVSDLNMIASNTKYCFVSKPIVSEIVNNILKINLTDPENLRCQIQFLSLENISLNLQELYNSL
jgi:teichuronic acid biosynthesis glycosyltransferase TuaC